eukprot:5987294-Amphidinium_carterae.1
MVRIELGTCCSMDHYDFFGNGLCRSLSTPGWGVWGNAPPGLSIRFGKWGPEVGVITPAYDRGNAHWGNTSNNKQADNELSEGKG